MLMLHLSTLYTSATFSREQRFTFDFFRREEGKGAGYGVG